MPIKNIEQPVVIEIDVALYRLDQIIPVCKSAQIVHL